MLKLQGRFFKFFVVFSENLNFNVHLLLFLSGKTVYNRSRFVFLNMSFTFNIDVVLPRQRLGSIRSSCLLVWASHNYQRGYEIYKYKFRPLEYIQVKKKYTVAVYSWSIANDFVIDFYCRCLEILCQIA